MNIDLRTLVIVLSISSVLQVIALFLQYRVNKAYLGIGWWLLGFTSLAMGYGFLLLRDLVSIKLVTIIFTNVLILSGVIFIYIGVMRFFDKKENRGIVISIFALFMISLFYYTYFDDDITLRTVVIYAAGGAISLLTAQSLFLNKIRSITASAYLNAVLFLSLGCYSAFRALVTLTVAPVNGLFGTTTIQTVSFLFIFVYGLLLTFGLIIMVNQRLNAGMTEVNEQLQSDIAKRERMEEALKESEKRYRELSIIDDLTQLYNSRQFYIQLKIELYRSNRYELPLTLLLLDIDNFKAFNDTYGHIEGDEVLKRLGQVVKGCLRETDSAYRYGGEEFTIILPMTTSANGAVCAERIRTEFKKESFSPATGQDVHLTMSIGLAQYKPQEEMKAFVHRVDQLMYQGKKNGKDRVCSEP